MKRKMFSRTTIASSMTMPTASVRARSVRTFSVKPIAYMSPYVETMDVGIAMAAMSVERRLPRKRRTTSAARKPPRRRCSWTVSTAALMNSPWSRTISVVYPAGSCGAISARRPLSASMTAIVFVPDCLRTERTTVGTPSFEAARSASSSLSSTVATSPIRTGSPLLCVMKMASNSFAL